MYSSSSVVKEFQLNIFRGKMKALIIDGYVDEPACFGVPPYISPYIRYLAGAMREQGIPIQDIFYSAIDSIRLKPKDHEKIIREADLVVIIAGMTVPESVPLLSNHENKTASRVGMVKAEIEDFSLTIDGEIVSSGDIATGIIEQAKAGADWQLSIGAGLI